MSSVLRLSPKFSVVRRAARVSAPIRAFHSPFVTSGNSPVTSSSHPHLSSVYEKQSDTTPEPLQGVQTYVVSEPDASSKFYSVPSGAYPTSSPYINFPSTEAPNTSSTQVSSTSSALAHEQTLRTVPINASGVGESASVRFATAPGEMGERGGSNGGLGLMDKKGTVSPSVPPTDRNPPPDGAMAVTFSRMGVDKAWKLRK